MGLVVKQLAGEKSKKVLSKSADLPISMDVGRVHNSPGALRVTRTVRRSSEMSGLILLAVMLVLATTATALVTGKVLAVKKNDVFQLEMVREAMRRKLHDLELRPQTVQGNLDLVAKIKQEKVEAVPQTFGGAHCSRNRIPDSNRSQPGAGAKIVRPHGGGRSVG